MKKAVLKLCLALILALSCASKSYGAPPSWIRFSFEWGYSQMFFRSYHFNYISDDGYRVDGKSSGFELWSNGFASGKLSLALSERLSIGLVSGYRGSWEENRMVPLMVELNYYSRGYWSDCFFGEISAGVGFQEKKSRGGEEPAVLSRLGGGYHYVLGGPFSLDFKVALSSVFESPRIPSPTEGYIEMHNVRQSRATHCALEFSLSINF
ncbi:MAG: hypothetical protein Q4D10_01630 [Bacteroidales bacterium]|nr:hypothetical protein [Bacteroidales bacterium]